MAKRENHRWALQELGLPRDFDLHTPQGLEEAMEAWKKLVVQARRDNNDERAATLSLCKTLIHDRHRYYQSAICPGCGNMKRKQATHCQVCRQGIHHGIHPKVKLDCNMELHKIEISAPIPAKHSMGVLRRALVALGEGNIGDSFVTDRSASSVVFLAKLLGGKVACRGVTPGEKDRKKIRVRVWRTDNLSMDEVNEIIKKRQAGEDVPKPPAWVIPPPEILAKLDPRNRKNRSKK